MATWLAWLSPGLIALTVVLLGRAHYTLYVLKRGNLVSSVITWCATLLVVGFWTWHFLM